MLKRLAFACGLGICAVGIAGLLAPSVLFWIAQQFAASEGPAFYVLAVIRIGFGLTLLAVASASRAPKTLRVLGSVIVILGITTAVAGLTALGGAQRSIEWWMQEGTAVARLTAIPIVALGAFVAWACALGSRIRQSGAA